MRDNFPIIIDEVDVSDYLKIAIVMIVGVLNGTSVFLSALNDYLQADKENASAETRRKSHI